MNFAIPNKNKGFTLVELLISIGLVFIIGTIGTSIIVSILRSYNKAHIINEIEQNGNYVLSLMESQIRNAGSVECGGGGAGDCLKVDVTSQEGDVLSFEMKDEGASPDTIGVVRKDTEIITNDDLTNGVDVVIDSGTPADASHFSVDDNKIKIVLKLQQAPNAPGRVDYQAETTLQTTVVVRGGYE